jgi:multicomponent Na+:H+ antiporter subunit E
MNENTEPAVYDNSLRWQHYAFVAGVSMLLWILLTGSLDRQELIAGGVVSFLVTVLFTSRLTLFTGLRFSWLAPVYLLYYFGNFLIALLRSNFDLAMRILSPSLPIRPEMVEVRTVLKSPLAKLMLANTITLTPGTLTVDVIGDRLQIHWVYCPPGTTSQSATEQIVTDFEKHIGRFLI